MSEKSHVYYALNDLSELIHHPSSEVVELSWRADLPIIRRFYALFGVEETEINPPTPDEPELGAPLALVRAGEILSFAIPFSFKEGEIEIGAVATAPGARQKGYCKQVISEMALRVLSGGKRATLTTGDFNIAMQRAAEGIGMKRQESGTDFYL